MRVLLVDDDKAERASIARMLQVAEHAVELAPSARTEAPARAGEPADVVVLAWARAGAADFVRRLRAGEGFRHTYVVVLLDKPVPDEISALFAAGADDFVRRPIAREELLARVEAPRRILRWASGVRSTGGLFEWSACADVRRLRACREMGRLVADDLAQMVGQPLDVSEGWSPLLIGELRGATIPMSLASEQTEIRVSIVVDAGSLSSLAATLLGDANAGEAALDDMLRELANNAGGAVKRASLEEEVTLTTGLPVNVGEVPVQSEAVRRWIATPKGSSVCFGIVGEIRARQNQRVLATKLAEGMVVAHDLKNEWGALLVPAGTRLTSTSAQRVARLVGERCVIEVACAT